MKGLLLLKVLTLAFFLLAIAGSAWGQIISQYVDTDSGTAPKGIEIWNNTGATLDFSVNNLVIEKGVNGAAPSTDYTLDAGTIAAGAVIVIGTSDMQTITEGNGAVFYEKGFTFNGDDALVVKYGGTTTDVFGTPESDPGSAWAGNGVSTANQNIVLISGITTGDTDGWTDPSERFETISTTPSGTGGLTGFGVTPGSDPPTAFTAKAISTSEIDLSWAQNGNGDDVLIVYNTDGNFTEPEDGESYGLNSIVLGGTVIYNASGTSFDHAALSSNTPYYYKAWSVDADNKYSTGVEVNATTFSPEPSDHATAFSASVNSQSSITLSWTDSDASSYLVKASADSYGDITSPTDGIAEADDVLVKNVATAENNSVDFTGLEASTTYYFKIFPYNGTGETVNYKTDGTVPEDNATTEDGPVAWINEIHYDNDGSDVDEMIEIVIKNPSNFSLANFSVNLYNGNGGVSYDSETAENMIEGNSVDTYTFYSWSITGIQNGPDGLALSYDGALIQFLSYEGSFTATDGPANGVLSTDMGVSETGSPPVGYSLQLAGHGTLYSDFSWQEPAQSTLGTNNNGQSLLLTNWLGTTDSDWNTGENWDNGIPSAAYKAMIADVSNDPIVSGSASLTNLEISSGGVLSVANDGQLTVTGTLTNNAGNNGLFIESNSDGTGSLLHNTNDVDMTMQRYVTGDEVTTNAKYHTVSVPLTAGSNPLSEVFEGAYLYNFDQALQEYASMGTSTTTPLPVDQGYLIYYPGTSTTFEFAGKANNGSFSTDVSYPDVVDNYNLVPNPYPSAIDWDAANGWIKNNINNAVYIYNTASSSSGNPLWASYVNGVAGVNGGSQYIPAGQAFFVQSNAADPVLDMTNDVRVHSAQAFYKESTEEVETLRLFAHANDYTDESVVCFNAESTTAFDGQFDALKFKNWNDAPNIYSLSLGKTALSISSIPYSTETYRMELGFEWNQSGEATIEMQGIESFGDWVSIVFEDRLTGITFDLRDQNTYSFQHETEADPTRFMLHFMGVTDVDELSANQTDYHIWTVDKLLHISNPATMPALLEVFDLQGRLMYSSKLQADASWTIDGLPEAQLLLIRVSNAETVVNQKLFIR